jgi:pyruvate ferredoxin oxidoreductase beta subunit/2-oxoisovalerate ferredoxin oxidoreductase beta subunit
MRLVLRAIGAKAIVVTVPSCVSVIAGPFPYAVANVPYYHAAFEVAAASAAGISNALKIQGKPDIPVLAFAGDGGTFDIGLQSLSGAADRNEDFIYVCYDNEGYMNTGIQVSSATPTHAWTGTTPTGNTRRKKQIMEIMAAHRIPGARYSRHPLHPFVISVQHRLEDSRKHGAQSQHPGRGDQYLSAL